MCFFPSGFESGMWDLIVLVPDRCLSFYFEIPRIISSMYHCVMIIPQEFMTTFSCIKESFKREYRYFSCDYILYFD